MPSLLSIVRPLQTFKMKTMPFVAAADPARTRFCVWNGTTRIQDVPVSAQNV